MSCQESGCKERAVKTHKGYDGGNIRLCKKHYEKWTTFHPPKGVKLYVEPKPTAWEELKPTARGKNREANYLAIASIICSSVGFFIIFATGLGLAGAFLGYWAVKQGSKLGYVALVFGVITFMFGMIAPWL